MQSLLNRVFFLITACLLIISNSYAIDKEWFETKLKTFEANPTKFMSDPIHVPKLDPVTMQPLPNQQVVDKGSIKEILKQKYKLMEGVLRNQEMEGLSKAAPNDQAYHLVDQLAYNTLNQMDTANLKSAALGDSPWSGSYWPIYVLGMARRFADPGFPDSNDWLVNHRKSFSHRKI
jgi:hypothetical protein